MEANWVGAALAFAVGVGIAALNYLFSKFILRKHPTQYASATILRQIIQILFLVLLFALGDLTPWNKAWLLVGGVLGITLPMIYFTSRLLKFNNGKEDKSDG